MNPSTLAAPARLEQDIRKSRFLAQAAPVTTPEAALAFLAEVADPAATHNCWAYRIGDAYRFSDDGEPASTAGKPILAAIDGQGYDQVMVVVTRWFGGIKLGAGGLVRAYGGCAAECLRQAERRELIPQIDARLHCGFAHAATVHSALEAHEALKQAEDYDVGGIGSTIRLPAHRFEALAVTLRDATRGQVELARLDDINENPAP